MPRMNSVHINWKHSNLHFGGYFHHKKVKKKTTKNKQNISVSMRRVAECKKKNLDFLQNYSKTSGLC